MSLALCLGPSQPMIVKHDPTWLFVAGRPWRAGVGPGLSEGTYPRSIRTSEDEIRSSSQPFPAISEVTSRWKPWLHSRGGELGTVFTPTMAPDNPELIVACGVTEAETGLCHGVALRVHQPCARWSALILEFELQDRQPDDPSRPATTAEALLGATATRLFRRRGDPADASEDGGYAEVHPRDSHPAETARTPGTLSDRVGP
jgi:hypothetical protein